MMPLISRPHLVPVEHLGLPAFSPFTRWLSAVLAVVALVALALALPGASHQAGATDWCSGGVCQEWVARYDAVTGGDNARALAVDGWGSVYATGECPGSGTSDDYATVKYSSAPILNHLAGKYGEADFSGDGKQAQDAQLYDPHGLYETADNTLYFADTGNGRIRRIQPRGPAGTITTVAGSDTQGYCGDEGPATSACLTLPRDVFVDDAGKHLHRGHR